MSALEAVIGVLLLVSLALVFALGVPGADEAETEVQLETFADDAATILANEPPRHAEQTRLSEVVASQAAFDRERGELERRIDRLLPDNLMFQVDTEYGTIGQPIPAGVQTGTTTVMTVNGPVTLEVWYA